jgi:uncharacterized protein (TIGR03067 family)
MIRFARPVLALLVASTVLAAPVPKAIKQRDDAKLLEGRWVSVTLDTGRGVRTDANRWVEFKEGKMTTGNGMSVGYKQRTIKLDPNAEPKHLTSKVPMGSFISPSTRSTTTS